MQKRTVTEKSPPKAVFCLHDDLSDLAVEGNMVESGLVLAVAIAFAAGLAAVYETAYVVAHYL